MTESQFIQRRAGLLESISGWLDSMNEARGVNWCEVVPGEIDKENPTYSDIARGKEAMIFRQAFPGRRASLEDEEIDPDRTIQIAIGRSEDWSIVVAISSSIQETPAQLIDPTDAALRDAIKNEHDRLFLNWPLTDAQFEEKGRELMREILRRRKAP